MVLIRKKEIFERVGRIIKTDVNTKVEGNLSNGRSKEYLTFFDASF